MDRYRRHLEEQLQKRELESTELRHKLHELWTKFVQLERAFEINLQSQTRRELELNHLKHESQELREFREDTLRRKAEINSQLIEAINERDHWKDAFHRQKEFIKRCEVEYETAMGSVNRECEDILKTTRDATQKCFSEFVHLYNEAKDKCSELENQTKVYRDKEEKFENRALELANLLETLKRFDVTVSSVCHFVSEALKNLTERENLFERSLKNLRHLTWTTEERSEHPEIARLRKQNFVLKEIVRNLKRKIIIYEKEREDGKNCAHFENEINSQNCGDNVKEKLTHNINCVVPLQKQSEPSVQKHYIEQDPRTREKCNNKCETFVANDNVSSQLKPYDNEDIKLPENDDSAKVFCVESHSNGIFYKEYSFKLSIDREMKLKYPLTINKATHIKMEFVDDENEYDKEPLDGILIFLRNIYASVNIKRKGVPCSTQTLQIKTSDRFTQTSTRKINTSCTSNIAVTMLNSEKRAIERSLRTLEETVAKLKLSALGQVQAMFSKDSRVLERDEFFECVKVLTR